MELLPVLYRPRVAEAGSAPSTSSRRRAVGVGVEDPDSSTRTSLTGELLLPGGAVDNLHL